MADIAVDEGAIAAEGAGKKGSKRKLILIAVPLILVLALGGALFFTGLGSLVGLGGSKAAAPAKGVAVAPTFFDLPEMLVNINAAGRRTGYMKIAVTLELADPKSVPHIQAVLPRILDNFQTYLRELRVEDLKGSAGLYRLREELLLRVNAAAAPARITDVLFKEILVQ
jgi:flagellar FliL protein